ncbi:hypothetical protein L3V77_20700 [Vibrio sp. DW001]|uniref:hypothetical protein n=1 Tax=Vibrio sp. DW001 TaxID=2912315 RepID=UPI0023B00886|nr:hypothetical protein [Vibrio sp. DW001]WED29828.1 hypothetical protein L3V77_20700 [Vibrio sp. DW001]
MDKAHAVLENEIEQLASRIEAEPETVLQLAKQSLVRADQVLYPEGGIKTAILISRCYWYLMDYTQGLKAIKDAHARLNRLDTDLFLPEILHVHALQFWGQAKYYSAQQFWINALEQAALVGETVIEIESLIGLGNVWRVTNEHKLAMSTHSLAVNVANNARINWLEGKARILLARDYYLLNNYIAMLSVLDTAEEVLQHNSNATWKAEIWEYRGLALLGLERVKNAEEATLKAYDLAMKHNLFWLQTQAYINRARLELIRNNLSDAKQLLSKAEKAAKEFQDGDLLAQICYQQSAVAEKQGDFQDALDSFQKYRRYSIKLLKDKTNRLGLDKARASKRQLDNRARKLINRIRRQVEFHHGEKGYSNLVSETYWWEQMVLFKSELKASTHAIILIQHDNAAYLEVCIEIAQCLCNRNDLISRLSEDRIGMLVAEKGEQAEALFQFILQTLNNYPWDRRGLTGQIPVAVLHDILSFPFTLEQLEDQEQMDSQNG